MSLASVSGGDAAALLKSLGVGPHGEMGHYNEKGEFVPGQGPGGRYREDGTWEAGYYDKSGVWHPLPDGTGPGYVDANGNWVSLADLGKAVETAAAQSKAAGGTLAAAAAGGRRGRPGKMGHYDAEGNWVEGPAPGGRFREDGTWEAGYYDKDGRFIPLPPGSGQGYLDESGIWHPLNEPAGSGPGGKHGHFNEWGEWVEGPAPGGRFREDGTWEAGYYDKNGVWHTLPDGTGPGYVDANGNWVSLGGGMSGSGPNGEMGHFNEKGEWCPGPAPGGRFRVDGTWEAGYYDKNGVWIPLPYGSGPGYVDANGNWVSLPASAVSDELRMSLLNSVSTGRRKAIKLRDPSGHFFDFSDPKTAMLR